MCLPLPRDVSVRLCVNYNLHANGSGDARSAVFTRHTAALHAAETWDGQTAVWWSSPPPTYEQACLRGWVVSFISFLLLHFFVSLGVASVAGSTVKEKTSSCALLRSLPFDFCFYPSGCKMNTACVSAHKCIHTHTHTQVERGILLIHPCVLQCVADLWSLILHNKWPLGPDRQRSRRGLPFRLL